MDLDKVSEQRFSRFRLIMKGDDRKSKLNKLIKVKNMIHNSRYENKQQPISAKRK